MKQNRTHLNIDQNAKAKTSEKMITETQLLGSKYFTFKKFRMSQTLAK